LSPQSFDLIDKRVRGKCGIHASLNIGTTIAHLFRFEWARTIKVRRKPQQYPVNACSKGGSRPVASDNA
jgi:hypothetical protein